ncbi:tRNA glutamyl-Q(34) synthetase GluQRS [Tessaracoccus sp. OH4464_COT-324]|uniref:tRNA glutamyl-Q(34) synthetase GluQRS n=1 Tax=Tessaracoccus sp. OH4464_COT-324 TaxID=2491059 RepID=UPI000F63D9E2|nr:tRNA glutamyl-Q(34) synthetase GluQRS [Tessaracoccus sp. OH4464_COT-324]RRD47524.1 tRNA glutamyl-Q(34) synthetase GluQRS [Tessaracoccus sp. OH4464_COT-324]
MHVDRYAPSPTSDLHLGNLRTALAGWLLARHSGGSWRMRVEDLDVARVRAAHGAEQRQLSDLARLGLDWDGEVMRQSERHDAYRDAVAALGDRVFECFCTRRDLALASSAPHAEDGYRPYPGTCLRLTRTQLARRRAERPAALRVRADAATQSITDRFAGEVTSVVDDFVLLRNDGTPAYNLAVVVDDIAMGVTHITRGDDLLSSAPRQAWLTEQLGGTCASYAHVSLVMGSDGKRLAKRNGGVTLDEAGGPQVVFSWLVESLGLGSARNLTEALAAMPADYSYWTSRISIT